MTRAIVCGGRDYRDRRRVFEVLDDLRVKHGLRVVIHGAATGADQEAEIWATVRGLSRHRFPAQWGKHGKAAGPIRNQQMIDKGRPDFVVAFPGETGTADMVRRARAAGVEVVEVDP